MRLRERPSPSELAGWWEEFRHALSVPAVHRLFERPAKRRGEKVELWRERSYALPAEPAGASRQSVLNGTFDRVEVIWRGGRPLAARILEFKTGRPDDGRDLEAPGVTRTKGGRYAEQIQRYRSALARMLHLLETHVQAELVWLDAGIVERL